MTANVGPTLLTCTLIKYQPPPVSDIMGASSQLLPKNTMGRTRLECWPGLESYMLRGVWMRGAWSVERSERVHACFCRRIAAKMLYSGLGTPREPRFGQSKMIGGSNPSR